MMDDLVSRETVRETLRMYIPGFKWDTIDKIVDMMPSAQPGNVFELDKPYSLKGFEIKMWKDVYGGDWVEIRKYQEPWRGEQDG